MRFARENRVDETSARSHKCAGISRPEGEWTSSNHLHYRSPLSENGDRAQSRGHRRGLVLRFSTESMIARSFSW